MEKSIKNAPSYGLLIYRYVNDELQYLLVHASGQSYNMPFSIPKGKKKNPKEPDLDAAIREVIEETGIVGKDFQYLGYVTYKKNDKQNHIWLAQYDSGEIDNLGECIHKDWENDIAHFFPADTAKLLVKEDFKIFIEKADRILK